MNNSLFNIEVGKRIRKFRLEKNITQRKLAESVMVSTSSITRLENGESMVSVFTIVEIAKALEVSVSEILTESEVFEISELKYVAEKIKMCTPEQRKMLIRGFEKILEAIFFEN